MGGFHNFITKILDPLDLMTKATGSNDPLDIFGGATKAREERDAKAVATATAAEKESVLGIASVEGSAGNQYLKNDKSTVAANKGSKLSIPLGRAK